MNSPEEIKFAEDIGNHVTAGAWNKNELISLFMVYLIKVGEQRSFLYWLSLEAADEMLDQALMDGLERGIDDDGTS